MRPHRPAGPLMSSSVRLYDAVRSAHLERAAVHTAAAIVYRRTRYDFDPSLAPGLELVRATRWAAAVLIARSEVRVLEINEPLLRSGLPGAALAVAVLRVRMMFRRRKAPLIVCYAIENSDPFAYRPRSLRPGVRWALDRVLAGFVWRQLDRVAFGTDAAADVYERRFGSGRRSLRRAVFPALPAAPESSAPSPRGHRVVFVGAFVPRKGILLLLDAWKHVLAEVEDATLLVMGKGPLAPQVIAAAARSGGTIEVLIDPVRAELLAHLAGCRVLVLPSQRTGSWREQVGLPIVEGLAAGCEIVTTDETGLARWLRSHGHGVVPNGSGSAVLAAAVVRQLSQPPLDVGAALPAEDGRAAADRWLFV